MIKIDRDEEVELAELAPDVADQAVQLRAAARSMEDHPTAYETDRMAELRQEIGSALRRAANAYEEYGYVIRRELSKGART